MIAILICFLAIVIAGKDLEQRGSIHRLLLNTNGEENDNSNGNANGNSNGNLNAEFRRQFGKCVEKNLFMREEGDLTILTDVLPAPGVPDFLPNEEEEEEEEEGGNRRRLSHYWTSNKWQHNVCDSWSQQSAVNEYTLYAIDCHTSGSRDWSSLLQEVVNRWNNIPLNQDGSGGPMRPNGLKLVYSNTHTCGSNGAISSYNDDYGNNGWRGLATISYYSATNTIATATSKINEYYSFDDNAAQHVLCQEIGHGFPLGHQSETGADLNTCMDYDSGLDNKYANSHDLDLINELYECERCVAIRSIQWNKWVACEHGDRTLNANRDAIGDWEKFRLIKDMSTGNYYLKSWHGTYLQTRPDYSLNCNRDPNHVFHMSLGAWERFELQSCGTDCWALKSEAFGRYVVAEQDTDHSLKADRTAIGAWEQFQLVNC